MRKTLLVLSLGAALTAGGCLNLAPDYERPEAPVAQASEAKWLRACSR